MMTVTHESAWMLMHMARLIEQINDVMEDYAKVELYIDAEGFPQIAWAYAPGDSVLSLPDKKKEAA
jgi:hypothetical protein